MIKLRELFKEIITEALSYKEYAHPAHLKFIAQNSKYSRARFVIHGNGKMNVGDAETYIHSDLHDKSIPGRTIQGYAFHDNGKFYFQAFKGSGGIKATDHPMLDRMRNAQISDKR